MQYETNCCSTFQNGEVTIRMVFPHQNSSVIPEQKHGTLGMDGQAQIIGTVARLIYERFNTLTGSHFLISRLLPNLHLVVVGEKA